MGPDQHKAPLFEALRQRRDRGESSFHVPGHKFGQGLDAEAQAFMGPVMGLDYTEIDGLDDLHHPEGVIAEAQELAAACFGAEESRFLVNGSTVGNLALLTAACGRGDRILVQRNVHKSVLHGLMLAGAEAVFLEPLLDPATGLAVHVPLETVKAGLLRHPEAKAVFLSNPNYYGMGVDLAPYAEAAHGAGVPLLVDEAHGAHFGLHPGVPSSALSCGADGVVQSTHKMLTGLTMGAMLHLQGPRLNRARVRQRLAMLQSSSPSYPIMASLDLARRLAATEGAARIGQKLAELGELAAEAEARLRCLKLVQRSEGSPYGYVDPFKLTVTDASGRVQGFALQTLLTERGIVPEMADDRHVVLACSLVTPAADLTRLGQALQAVDRHIAGLPPAEAAPQQAAVPGGAALYAGTGRFADGVGEPVRFGLDEADRGAAAAEALPWDRAVGRRSAETVIPYPPGIPLLYAGEVIRPDTAERIRLLAQAGARFQGGLQDPSGCSILVEYTK